MEELLPQLRKHSRAFVREFGFFKSHYEDTNATYGETHALIEIRRLGALEVGELSRLLNVDKTGASKLLSQMERKGWVKPVSSEDARKKLYSLTTIGKKLSTTIEELADKKVSFALSELSKVEQENILRAMELFTGALKSSRARREFTIRPCEPKDNKAIASIVKRSLKDLGFAGPGTAAADPSVNYLSSFNTDRQCYLVAEKDGKIMGGAGIIGMKSEGREVCELVRMFLHPEARSSGLAQLLMDSVLVQARGFGYRVCYLETTERMKAAQSLYRKNGFDYVKKRRGNTGHFACNVLMEKKL